MNRFVFHYLLLVLCLLSSSCASGAWWHKKDTVAYRYDTIPAVYDSVYHEGKSSVEYYLEVDTVYVPLLSKCYKVNSWASSAAHLQSHATEVQLVIPTDEVLASANKCQKKGANSLKFHSFCYWIGVGDESLEAYQKQTKASKGLIGAISSILFDDYGPLITGALSVVTDQNGGNNVKYSFYSGDKVYDDGNVKSASAALKNITPGSTITLSLKNDNYLTSIDVNVRVMVKQLRYTCKSKTVKAAGYYTRKQVSPMRIEKVEIK